MPNASKDEPPTYTCEACGGTFTSGWDDDAAQAESVQQFGVRGDAPFMACVCDDCYQELLAWLKTCRS